VQQTVLVAIEEYISMRETAEILADPAAFRGLAEARESEQAGNVVYGAEAARALLAERWRRWRRDQDQGHAPYLASTLLPNR
jgi:hypothetical protein